MGTYQAPFPIKPSLLTSSTLCFRSGNYEPPRICPDDHTVLEEGMVISTEPKVAMNLLWEDVHVITADGHDQLTSESVALREIPFG